MPATPHQHVHVVDIQHLTNRLGLQGAMQTCEGVPKSVRHATVVLPAWYQQANREGYAVRFYKPWQEGWFMGAVYGSHK